MPGTMVPPVEWGKEEVFPRRKRAISDCGAYACSAAVEICEAIVDGAPHCSAQQRHAAKASVADAMALWMEALVEQHAQVTEADCDEKFATASLFWARTVPGIGIRDYAARIARYGGCSPAALVVACVLAQRFIRAMRQRTQGHFTLNPFTVHRVLLACCVLGTKLQDDLLDDAEAGVAGRGPPCTNSEWALVGGVSVREVNRLEIAVLQTLNFSTYVRPRRFMQTIEMLWARGFLDSAESR